MGITLLILVAQIVNAPAQLVTQQFASPLECSNFARTLQADAQSNEWGTVVNWHCTPITAYPAAK
jgi:hypothetical protein